MLKLRQIMNKACFFLPALLLSINGYSQGREFLMNDQEYFENNGVDFMSFQDIYPEGHQGGVAIIMYGTRIATNGDLRLDDTPGQWQPVPKQQYRQVDRNGNRISVSLTFPDSSRMDKGFNPVSYPGLYFNYTVNTRAEGASIIVSVDLDRPLPDDFAKKVGFNMELFPGCLFGKSWYMDDKSGIFPRQVNGPGLPDDEGKFLSAAPMASGNTLVIAPEDEHLRLTISSRTGKILLLDGRYRFNNGWFVIRTKVAPGKTKGAVEWVFTPDIIDGWIDDPVIHVSQVGYRPDQLKKVIVEVDKNDIKRGSADIIRIAPDGSEETVLSERPAEWGRFLRYNYLTLDFSGVRLPGIYKVKYATQESQLFRISGDVFERDVWQPVLEYFLPVQMCHMRVNEKYRVWHGLCHMDDALMAPVNHNHFDGYHQGESTLTVFRPGEHVPGLNAGGWHDAGDYDLRVESQAGEVYILTQAWEAFHPGYDETSIDQASRLVEIHKPDGKPDILQQIEHGALSVAGAYQNLGRLYRGMICPTLEQYVLLGDGVNMTDGQVYTGNKSEGDIAGAFPAKADDRWVFTEDNPARELTTAAELAAASRALKGYNDTLSTLCLRIAEEIFNKDESAEGRVLNARIHAAVELLRTTRKPAYRNYILTQRSYAAKNFRYLGWIIGPALEEIGDPDLTAILTKAAADYSEVIAGQGAETPFGVPYRPHIWGAGWDIQDFGVKAWYLHKAFPGLFPADYYLDALNFILGVHPGSNTSSFASGVGTRSATVAYGVNRADWSYIPGGVVSGTALIRPDFPELLDWPYLWQQQEYVMGGGATNFMFLVLAANAMPADGE